MCLKWAPKQHKELKIQQQKDGKIYNQGTTLQRAKKKKRTQQQSARQNNVFCSSGHNRDGKERALETQAFIGKAKDHCKHSLEPEHNGVHICHDTKKTLPRHLQCGRPSDQPPQKKLAMLLNRNLNAGNTPLIKCPPCERVHFSNVLQLVGSSGSSWNATVNVSNSTNQQVYRLQSCMQCLRAAQWLVRCHRSFAVLISSSFKQLH